MYNKSSPYIGGVVVGCCCRRVGCCLGTAMNVEQHNIFFSSFAVLLSAPEKQKRAQLHPSLPQPLSQPSLFTLAGNINNFFFFFFASAAAAAAAAAAALTTTMTTKPATTSTTTEKYLGLLSRHGPRTKLGKHKQLAAACSRRQTQRQTEFIIVVARLEIEASNERKTEINKERKKTKPFFLPFAINNHNNNKHTSVRMNVGLGRRFISGPCC